MYPAACDFYPSFAFFGESVVALVTISDDRSFEVFQEFFRMIFLPGLLVFVDDYRFFIECAAAVYPHVALGPGFSSVFCDQNRSLICMDHYSGEQRYDQPVIQQRQVSLCTFHYPARHRLP